MARLINLLDRRDDFFAPLEQAFNEHFNEFFNGFFNKGTLNAVKDKVGYPKLDISESDEIWRVDAAVPGVSLEDLKVEVVPGETKDSRALVITGQMTAENEKKEPNYHVKELKRSSFKRVVSLPDYVIGDPEAELKNGILSLAWKTQKKLDKPQTKLISIKG